MANKSNTRTNGHAHGDTPLLVYAALSGRPGPQKLRVALPAGHSPNPRRHASQLLPRAEQLRAGHFINLKV